MHREIAPLEQNLAEARAAHDTERTDRSFDQVRRAQRCLDEAVNDSCRVVRLPGPPDAADCRERHHWDGRVDARVRPRPVHATVSLSNPFGDER